jgi:aromatic-L-amino-acid decarboxylase
LDPDARDIPAVDLEFPPDEMRLMGREVLERVVRHIESLPYQPSRGDVGDLGAVRAMCEAAPEEGTGLDAILDSFFGDWVGRSYTAPGPGYLAFIPGGGLFAALLADMMADGTNRFAGFFKASPALVQLEANALQWLRDAMGFPEGSAGVFTTGGSMANFNAVVCARERLLGPDPRSGVLYASSQAHHSVLKCARLAAIAPDRCREVPVDAAFRMRPDALADAIAADRAAGLKPFLVVSSAGTTNTGAVDPLVAIGGICRREGLWHHVDGAYGAFFAMCDGTRPALAGMDAADSLTLDPHKGMFLPYGTGALLVRDGAALREAHRAGAGYLPATVDPAEFYDPHQHGPDLSRGFPGLRVWLAVKLHGMRLLRSAIAEKRALAVDAWQRIRRVPCVVIDAEPELSLFAFHLERPGMTRDESNRATAELVEAVTARGRVMITGCRVDGRELARVCVLSFRTHLRDIDFLVSHVEEEAAKILL